MATSVYFNNFAPSVINENLLLEDIIVESIQMMGHDVKYMPREVFDSADDVLGESPNAKFSRAYTIEMYLANVEGYEGDGDFFSKFGLEIRDTSNFICSARSFKKYIPSSIAIRPREGDLIFVPLLQKIFEIKFVEEELLFFSLGKRNPYIFEMRCEVFRYSNEDISTGDEEIDDKETSASYTVKFAMTSGNGNFSKGETLYQGTNLASATATATVKEWNPFTKVLEVVHIKGAFANTSNVIGATTNSVYTSFTIDDLADLVTYDDSDNRILQTEADNFIDLSEKNPFGVP